MDLEQSLQIFTPQENQKSIQDCLFILEYKFHFTEKDSMNMDRWIANKRINQLIDYNKEKKNEIEKATNDIKN